MQNGCTERLPYSLSTVITIDVKSEVHTIEIMLLHSSLYFNTRLASYIEINNPACH